MFCRRLAASPAFLLALIALCLLAPQARAQSILSGGTIEEVRVEGTQRIEPATVRSYLRLDPGDPFDPVLIDSSLKSIFATGLFADVTLRRDGDTLIVRVVENPIINQIAFEGNDELDDETLQAEVELRPRIVFTRNRVQSDVQRLLELYRRSGYFAATIDPQIIELPQNRVDLVFVMNEGPETGVDAINFVGNRAFSDSRLREEVATSESAFWKLLSTADTYDPDRLAFDRELLRRFYLSEGYADFRVVSAVAELTPDRSGFIITFTVDEGERYDFGEIEIETTLRNLDPEVLRGQLEMDPGDTYDATEVEQTIDNLTDEVGNLGYAFVSIRPRADRDPEARIIDVTFAIDEGPKVYVERIDIEGNVRTLDRVIRREFRFAEGDAFNASKIRRSRQRIQNLGFFSAVEVDNEPGSAPDRSVVKVAVEEQSTGDLTFGAGFSTAAGPLGNITLRERNLLGRGQDLRIGFLLAAERSEIDLSFTEPYFLGRDLAAGFDLFRVTQDQEEESSFNEERLGGGLRAGFDWTEHTRQVWRYTLLREDLRDIPDDASLVIKSEEGSRIESAIGQELTYDKRDSRFDPREGWITTFTTRFAGIGGDASYLRGTLGGGIWFPVADELTLSFRSEIGAVEGLWEPTQVTDRFFIGSSRLRGFEFGGVGPRDADTDDSLGAKYFYTASAEFSFPLGLPEEFAIRGRVFTDVGAAWALDNETTATVNDSSSPRVSAGVGISWESPFGPIIVDLGYPLVKEPFDKEELINFSFGTSF